ncbi:MAG: hypothetical protein AAFQ82_25400, partial [Myxococcota bacterium]
TAAEMLDYRTRMGNTHPFIVENGSKVFIPKGYFSAQPAGTHEENGYWVRNLGGRSRTELLTALVDARMHNYGDFTHFAAAGAAGIVALTNGLTMDESVRANMRMGTESALWTGTQGKERFVEFLRGRGVDVVEGGKFTTLTGSGTKGKALEWLTDLYAKEFDRTIQPVALGDGGNDLPALQSAQALGGTAVVVAPRKAGKKPLHQTDAGRSLAEGEMLFANDLPARGWADAMGQVMKRVGVDLGAPS